MTDPNQPAEPPPSDPVDLQKHPGINRYGVDEQPSPPPTFGPPDAGYQHGIGQAPSSYPGYAPPNQEPGQPTYGAPGTGPGYGPGYPQQGYPQAGYAPGGPSYPYNPYDPQAPFGRNVMGVPFSDKQKVTAGLLQILLGAFGAGRFYLEQPGIAVAQIAVTWLTCGLGGIWPLIDGIMMLTGKVEDQYGRPLRD